MPAPVQLATPSSSPAAVDESGGGEGGAAEEGGEDGEEQRTAASDIAGHGLLPDAVVFPEGVAGEREAVGELRIAAVAEEFALKGRELRSTFLVDLNV